MTPKTDQSQHVAAPKTDQTQQDPLLSPDVIPDVSGDIANDSDVPPQVLAAHPNQDSIDQTKDDGTPDIDCTPVKIGNCSDYSWDAKKRQNAHE